MKEKWRPIKGYEDLYEVSTFGNVRRSDGTAVYVETHHKGYLRVDLFRNGVREHKKVHRLVAEAFIPNPENKPQINHKDFDTTNNRVWNLEWVTNRENYEYSKKWKDAW